MTQAAVGIAPTICDVATTSPPHDLAAEASVLGAILLDNEAGWLVSETLKPEHFYRSQNATIFRAMLAMLSAQTPVDAVTLPAELKRQGVLEAIGGLGYLSELVNAVPSAAAVETYAEAVQDAYALRQLAAAGRAIHLEAYSPADPADAIIDRAEARLLAIITGRIVGATYAIGDVLAQEVARIDAGTEARGLKTGLIDLDRITGGLKPGEITILAARPGAGKTSLASMIALNSVTPKLGSKTGVLFFSLEMTRQQLVQNIAGQHSRVSMFRVRRGEFTEHDRAALGRTMLDLKDAPLFVQDGGHQTVTTLRSRARLMRMTRGIGLVVVDYLQLLHGEGGRRSDNREQEIAGISRGLKLMAKELEIPVLVLAQVNRAVESRDGNRPRLSDLRECFAGNCTVYQPDTGRWTCIQALQSGAVVAGLNNDRKIERTRAECVWSTGRKPVFRLRTRTGREITTTNNHPFLTWAGWTPLEGIQPGERIAVARVLPCPTGENPFTADEARLIGYLISDGSYLKHQVVSYTKADQSCLDEVEAIALRRFGITAKRESRGKATDMDLTGPRLGPGRNPLINWLREIGIHDQRNRKKRIPEKMWGAPNSIVAHFIATLWAGDGAIVSRPNGGTIVKFVSTSRGLLHDIHRLLLRFGVVSRIGRPGRNTKSTMDIATLSIGESDAIIAFAKAFELPGTKGQKVRKAAMVAAGMGRNPQLDRLPLAATEEVRLAAMAKKVSHATLGYRCQGKEIGRADLFAVAERLGDARLSAWATSDVMWDKVVSIEPAGEEETFDVRVPTTGNLVVDGFIAHNSGSVEQDADVVMLLYREAYYKPDKPEIKTQAEVIVAKNRNGPTGSAMLRFDAEFMRFDNAEARKP